MQFTAFHRLARISVLLCAPILAFGQGLYWETTTTIQIAGEQSIDTKSYYLPRMFKQGSDKEAVVFRLDKQAMYAIDYEKKEYSEITFAELEAYIKRANTEMEAQIAELKKHLASIPEDQRKAMEQMLGGQIDTSGGTGKVDVTKTSETKTISGYACTNYALKKEGKEVANVWTTTNIPDFNAMQKDFKEFGQKLTSQMTMNGPQMAEAMQKVDGFPIQTTISGMTATVTKVSKSSVAKSEFEIPAGFKKVPFEEKEGKRGRGMDDMPGDEGGDGEKDGQKDGEKDDGGRNQ